MFRVPWVDDEGKVQVNRGFRVQFNSCHRALQGRPAPASVRGPGHHQVPRLRADLQEQPDQRCPWAAARAAATSTRRASRDMEVMRFCQSFMTELCRHIGADTDVPAGDIGTGAREIGYLFGQYKRINERLGRRAHRQGPVLRRLAGPHAGDGLRPVSTSCRRYLSCHDDDFAGKTVAVSGSGNVAIYATEKATAARRQGGRPVRLHRLDPRPGRASTWTLVKQIKEVERGRISEYAKRKEGVDYHDGRGVWSVPVRHRAAVRHAERAAHRGCAKQLVANGVQDRGGGREHAHHAWRPPTT